MIDYYLPVLFLKHISASMCIAVYIISLRAEFQITKLYVRYIQLYAPYANNIKHIYVVVDFLLHHTSLKILKTISISTSNQKHTSSYILRMKKY